MANPTKPNDTANQELERKVGQRTAELQRENQRLRKEIEECRLSEETVRESGERLRTLVENTPSLIFIKDESGRYVYLNEVYERQFVGSKDWHGKTDFDFWPRESAKLFASNDAEVLKSGKTHQFMEDLQDLEGNRHCWLCYKFFFSDSKGKRYVGGVGIDATDYVRAEEALRESEARYRTLHETLRDPFVQVDMEGRIVAFNDLYCEMLGYSPQEISRLTYQELTPERWHAFEEQIVREQIIARGYSDVYEKEYRRKDGTVFPAELRTILFRDVNGKPQGMWGVCRDITERKRMDEENRRLLSRVKEENDKLAAVLDNIQDEVWFSDTRKTFTLANPAALKEFAHETTGIDVEKLASTLEVYRADGTPRPIDEAPPLRALKGEKVRNIEEIIRTPSGGELRHREVSAAPVRDAEGTIIGSVSVVRDITERKRLEEELRRSRDELEERVKERTAELQREKRRLADIIYATNVGTWEWNVQTGETSFSERWANIIGYTLDELEPLSIETWRKYSHPDDLALSDALLEKHFVGELPYYECEVRTRHKNGNWVWVLDRGKVVAWTDEGKPLLMSGTHQDITEHKRLEEELRQAHKMEALGTFSGGIAHDFNNMLAVILGNAELALDDIDEMAEQDSGMRRNIEQIIKASKRSRDLVKQILQFSRKDAIQKRKPLRLAPLLNETVGLLRGSIPSTVVIDLNIAAEEPTILGDSSQIQQVLMNLASNAVYAMGDDGGSLTIRLSEVTFHEGELIPDGNLQLGRYIKLSVSDTGTGIAKEVRARIFEPFFTTKKVREGTGMGLSVSFGIIKGHDGAITVESEEGQGSTFNLFFPAYAEPHAIETRRTSPAPEGGTERILLVDDEPQVLAVVAGTLRSLGYEVVTAPLGSEALKTFKEDPGSFDLIITDHVMPEMTGIRLAEKALKVRKDIRVILFAGYSDAVTPDKAEQAGIRSFVMKPVVKRELAEVVRGVLDGTDRD